MHVGTQIVKLWPDNDVSTNQISRESASPSSPRLALPRLFLHPANSLYILPHLAVSNYKLKLKKAGLLPAEPSAAPAAA